jgi:hypothetical protein
MGAHRPPNPDQSFRLDLSARGYLVLFRPDEPNHCPGCGHSQWFVGRVSAECGICGTALPLAADSQQTPVSGAPRKAVALHVLPDLQPREAPDERRKQERVKAVGRTLGLYIDGSPHAFRIENISEGGAMGRAIPGIRQAKSLLIELEDGRMVPAELRWSDGVFAGLAFLSDSKAD